MFKRVEVPMRTFFCELKHRPPGDDGSNEELIDVMELKVPKLRNSDMEKQWAIALLWNLLDSPEFLSRDINQIFVFTAQFGELIMRMESKPFTDEPAKKLTPPEEGKYSAWQKAIDKRFKSLYGVSVDQWRGNALESPSEGIKT